MSIEIDYLRKKATDFRRRQIIGLIITVFGLVAMGATYFLIPVFAAFSVEPWKGLETYITWSMTVCNLIAYLGVVITIYYSKKLSEFVTDWSRMMEELERRLKEIEN